jgi:hypothetical protein
MKTFMIGDRVYITDGRVFKSGQAKAAKKKENKSLKKAGRSSNNLTGA